MQITNPGQCGPIMKRVVDEKFRNRTPLEWILGSSDVEVYFYRESKINPDPEFLMATSDDVLVRFAVTGDMMGMYKRNQATGSLDAIVEMDTKHRFHLDRKTLPINGVMNNTSLTDENILESLVGYSYQKAKAVRDFDSTGIAKYFQVLTYEAIVARFNLLKIIQSSTDIIPDQTPRTIFVKAGDGCAMNCSYCPEGAVKFVPYSERQFIEHLELIGTALTDILGSEGIRKMNEGFINISDLGWLDAYKKMGKTDLSSVRAAQLMLRYFPWLEKKGFFIGSPTALGLSKDNLGAHKLRKGNLRYSSDYFKRLYSEGGLNRAYIGIETSHDEGSALFRKPVTYEQKLLASNLIQDAGIRLKAIVQIGLLGQGFYPLHKRISPENFVPWHVSTDLTAKWINEAGPYRVLESDHQHSEELPIQELIRTGRLIPYTCPKQFDDERERLGSGIKVYRNDFKREGDYQKFLPHQKSGGCILVKPTGQ